MSQQYRMHCISDKEVNFKNTENKMLALVKAKYTLRLHQLVIEKNVNIKNTLILANGRNFLDQSHSRQI